MQRDQVEVGSEHPNSRPRDKKMESRRVRNQKTIPWGQMSEEFEPQEVKMWKLERQIRDIVKIQFHTGTITEVHRTDFLTGQVH